MNRNIIHTSNFKERLPIVLFCLLWGIAIASAISYILESYLSQIISVSFLFFVIFVPIIEESTKISGLFFIKKWLNESNTGFLLGISAGIGFAITETFIYGLKYSNQAFLVIIAFLFLRIIGAGIMHASSTGILGYGYANYTKNKKPFTYLIPFFTSAIMIHALFNLITFSSQSFNQVFLILLSVLFSLILMLILTKKIYLFEKNKKTFQPNPSN